MTIYSHRKTLFNLDVVDYEPGQGLAAPEANAYKIALSWDDSEAGKSVEELLQRFLAEPKITQVRALILGYWTDAYEESPQGLIELLVAHKDSLPNLRAIFIGDIVAEECEISWINQGQYQSFFQAFPHLEHFQVRGSTGLELGVINHDSLQTLIVECGGLPRAIIEDICRSNLPALTHLELWLGTEDYGYSATRQDLENLINTSFPKLTYLGLRDSEAADDVAEIIANAPILKQLSVLDLSLGTLTDKGAQALLNSPFVALLDKLDLHHHYMSDALQQQLSQLDLDVDVSEPQQEDHYKGEVYRYVAVSE